MSKVDIQERGNMAVSDNGKVYEGMKKPDGADVSKMSVFNFADINKDGVISKAEVERYNAPIFMKNYDTTRELMFGANRTTPFDKNGYTEFYAGLDIKSINEKVVSDFKLIDIDNDGIISKSEMVRMEKAFNETQNIKNKVKSIAQKSDIIKWITGAACVPIPIAMFAWFAKDFEGIAHAPFWKYMATSGAIVLGLGLLGVGTAYLIKKIAEAKAQKLGEATDNHPYALSKMGIVKKEYNTTKTY